MTKSFGRRGAGTAPSRQASSPYRAPQTTSSQASSALGEPEYAVAEEKEGGKLKSFAFACISGLTFSIIAMGLFVDSNAPSFFGSRFFLNIASAFALFMVAPFLLIASWILAEVMRLIQVPRGYSDIMIGALVGSVMFLPSLTSNEPMNWKALAFVIGGAIGGFIYWRSRGYPGMKRKYTKAAEVSYDALKRM